jgi:hypothetical protein
MKTLILAAMAVAISVPALSLTTAPSKAASVTITTDDNMRHDRNYWRHHHRDREDWRHRHHARKCKVKIEKRWRHGHMVVRKVKVCRVNRDW